MRGATDSIPQSPRGNADFYSHAPCGARPGNRKSTVNIVHFYSHAPCGARRSRSCWRSCSRLFLLTRPMRGATRSGTGGFRGTGQISTHTPHAGRDEILPEGFGRDHKFLLTRPMRGATATYSIRNSRTSYIQEADSKIITKYSIKFNILHDSAIKSRRTCLSFMHHNTFACYSP